MTSFPLRTTPLFQQYIDEYSFSIQSTKIRHKSRFVLHQISHMQPLYHLHLYSFSTKTPYIFKDVSSTSSLSRFQLLFLFLHNLNLSMLIFLSRWMGTLADQDSTFLEYNIPMGKYSLARPSLGVLYKSSVTRFFNWKVTNKCKYLHSTPPCFSLKDPREHRKEKASLSRTSSEQYRNPYRHVNFLLPHRKGAEGNKF